MTWRFHPKQRTPILLSAAIVLFGTAGTLAADAIVAADTVQIDPSAPQIMDTAIDWSGFYAGVFGGYSGGDAEWTFPTVGTEASPDPEGALGGALVGYNHQFEYFVIGVEGDLALTNMDGSDVCPNAAFNCQVEFDWFATLRARAGVPMGRGLFYVTGGLAGAQLTPQFETVATGAIGSGGKETQWGWTVGGGAEFAVRDNISLRGEALYFDLGSSDYLEAFSPNNINLGLTGYQARAAVVFRFP